MGHQRMSMSRVSSAYIQNKAVPISSKACTSHVSLSETSESEFSIVLLSILSFTFTLPFYSLISHVSSTSISETNLTSSSLTSYESRLLCYSQIVLSDDLHPFFRRALKILTTVSADKLLFLPIINSYNSSYFLRNSTKASTN